ncbi:hypothetical protein TNCV_3141991 [Trichonephila clavipes]|nr:hypothetical protein TNCV_3141991 [Trichonephila clavipes]
MLRPRKNGTAALANHYLTEPPMIGKEPSTVVCLIKLVQRFEKTGSLEDGVKSGRPSLRIISKRCKFTWPPRSLNLTPVDFWQLDIKVFGCCNVVRR